MVRVIVRCQYSLVKIWDYHSKSCVQTLESHTANVSFAIFHPSLPIIISGSEDGTVKIWHSSTYRLENTLNYGLERCWCIAYKKTGNEVAIGYDEGAVVIKVCIIVRIWFRSSLTCCRRLSCSSVAKSHLFRWTYLERLFTRGTPKS
jgi:WD40 repeat protein